MGALESKRRRAQNRDEARRMILDATEALLAEEGYEGFSMRKLVERCGYAAPSIYHHFGDKRGLIDALLESRFRKLVDELEGVPASADPTESMRELSRAFVRFGLRNSAHYTMLSAPLRGEKDQPVPAAEEARRILETPAEEVFARGEFAVDDLEVVRQSLWGLIHGLITLQGSRPDHAWSGDLFDVAFEAMLVGLLVPEAAGAVRERELKRRRRNSSNKTKRKAG